MTCDRLSRDWRPVSVVLRLVVCERSLRVGNRSVRDGVRVCARAAARRDGHRSRARASVLAAVRHIQDSESVHCVVRVC
jgi:hypothetical protein